MLNSRVVAVGLVAVVGSATWVMPAEGQDRRPTFHASIGSFHHASNLHTYFSTRFADAVGLGAGVAVPLNRAFEVRLALDRTVTHLTGHPAFPAGRSGPDRILAAEVHLVAVPRITNRVRLNLGAGGGLRRYTVNSTIARGDIIESPWSEAQVRPARSVLAGVSVDLNAKLGVAADVRWSQAQFRAGPDSWGLPRDPIEWQREIRPGIRFAVSP